MIIVSDLQSRVPAARKQAVSLFRPKGRKSHDPSTRDALPDEKDTGRERNRGRQKSGRQSQRKTEKGKRRKHGACSLLSSPDACAPCCEGRRVLLLRPALCCRHSKSHFWRLNERCVATGPLRHPVGSGKTKGGQADHGCWRGLRPVGRGEFIANGIQRERGGEGWLACVRGLVVSSTTYFLRWLLERAT